MTQAPQEKQLRLVMAVMRASDYSHPVVLSTCRELNLSPSDLKPRRFEEFVDKKASVEIQELRFQHFEARRKARLDLVALKIQKNNELYLKLLNRDRSIPHNQRCSLSLEQSGRESHLKPPDISLETPLIIRDPVKNTYFYLKKKLDRLLKVIGNIQDIKKADEVRRMRINSEDDKKRKKIEEDRMSLEEKRLKKINENQLKRQEILRKKYEVLNNKEELELENRAIRFECNVGRRLAKKDSMASLTCRSVTKRINRKIGDDDFIPDRLENIQKKLEKSSNRVKHFRLQKTLSGVVKNEKLMQVKEKKQMLAIEEENKAIEKLGTISNSIEKSRMKREEKMKETVEKINESHKAKMLRLQEEKRKEKEKEQQKELEFLAKEKARQRARELSKDWSSQQSAIMTEINTLKRNDQMQNYLKNQESFKQLKEKVMNKHKNHDKILENLKNNQKKLSKIKSSIEAEISSQRAKHSLINKESFTTLDNQIGNMKNIENSFLLTEISRD